MIRKSLLSALLIAVLVVPIACGGSDEQERVFPVIAGWTPDGEPRTYSPDDLFEYINGAADVYLGYGFKELVSLSFDRGDNQSLTIDMYRHDSKRNAYGIYSQEKPAEADFSDIGSRGYYEQGVLNFWMDHYYVKLAGFELGDADETVLEGLARDIAEYLEGDREAPAPVGCLPEKRMILNSDRFIARDFMGHGFLCCAFVAEYEINGVESRVFIIEAYDGGGAREMLEQYLEFVEKSGNEVVKDKGVYRFQDPYQASSGPLYLTGHGRYIWGFFTDDPEVAAFYLGEVEDGLAHYGLIE